ncbi:MAG: iron ABC transporter permease [Candidatus Ruminococcus intestinipullorum]|nr:iron ABC transporter permease [Candidatus Ruminococcus intestinipullorum]
MRKIIAFLFTFLLIAVVFFWAVNTGGLETTVSQLLKGLFVEYDETVAIILELRFPRIIVAILGGALMAVSGVLMQAMMKNPLADPGIIGITSGAALTAVVISAFAPALAKLIPVFSFVGGMVAFILVYMLAWNGQISPIRLLLIGIAVDAMFSGLTDVFSTATGGEYSGAANILNSNISLKTWGDVKVLTIYFIIAAICCVFIAGKCNLLALSDQTMHSLGINVNGIRLVVSGVSVLMASIFTSVIGSVSFLGLIVPHIARLIVGSDNRVLIPYSACLGAVVFLLADTIGRTLAYPYEISPSIIMAVIGGPMLIILLKRERGIYG